MAITPKEAQGTKRDPVIRKADELERNIDFILQVQFDGRSRVWYPIPHVDKLVIAELLKRYRAAGWKVEVTTTHPEGMHPDVLVFGIES